MKLHMAIIQLSANTRNWRSQYIVKRSTYSVHPHFIVSLWAHISWGWTGCLPSCGGIPQWKLLPAWWGGSEPRWLASAPASTSLETTWFYQKQKGEERMLKWVHHCLTDLPDHHFRSHTRSWKYGTESHWRILQKQKNCSCSDFLV